MFAYKFLSSSIRDYNNMAPQDVKSLFGFIGLYLTKKNKNNNNTAQFLLEQKISI